MTIGSEGGKLFEKRELKESAIFPATIESVAAIRDGIEQDLERLGWKTDEIQDFVIAVGEAAANSVGRGSLHIGKIEEGQTLSGKIREQQERMPDAEITVRASLGPEAAEVTIEDEGDGFDFEAKLKKDFEERDFTTNGRGVALMAQLVEVRYENGGRRIILSKKRNTTDGAAPTE